VPNGGDVCELKNGREYMYVWSIDRYWRKNTLSYNCDTSIRTVNVFDAVLFVGVVHRDNKLAMGH